MLRCAVFPFEHNEPRPHITNGGAYYSNSSGIPSLKKSSIEREQDVLGGRKQNQNEKNGRWWDGFSAYVVHLADRKWCRGESYFFVKGVHKCVEILAAWKGCWSKRWEILSFREWQTFIRNIEILCACIRGLLGDILSPGFFTLVAMVSIPRCMGTWWTFTHPRSVYFRLYGRRTFLGGYLSPRCLPSEGKTNLDLASHLAVVIAVT